MYYFIGDIHGYLASLAALMRQVLHDAGGTDTFIFLGDYIDRGDHSFEVIEYLMAFSRRYSAVFLKGNHEDMFMKYLNGEDRMGIYLLNGGAATVRSYNKNVGSMKLPPSHDAFFRGLRLYFEGDDFIAVHGGLDPSVADMASQKERYILWIRDRFFRADKRWGKTVIFGHTPTEYISHESSVYFDDKRNIIGIDTGVMMGHPVSCLRWPDRKVYSDRNTRGAKGT